MDVVAAYNKERTLRERLSQIPPQKLAFRNYPAYLAFRYPKYLFSKHHLLIAKALMQIEAGNLKRLIVTMPPRHGKTMSISEYFPTWYLGRNPTHQIISTTYSWERAGDVGRKVRNLMLDPKHIDIFPHCTLDIGSKSVNRLTTDQEGTYFSVGVGGAVVGRGANVFIIDDPVKNREEAESERSREKLWDWYRGVAYTRLMPEGAIIAVATRWHFDDLIGRMIEQMAHENWTILNLPAVCDSEDDLLGRDIGDALWNDFYSLDSLNLIKETIGTREWNAQYQQQPLPAEGGVIDLNWIKKYSFAKWAEVESRLILGVKKDYRIPFDIKKIVISWDTAFKEQQMNDPSACTVWGISKDNKFYLLNVINKRMRFPALRSCVIKTWEKYIRLGLGNVPVLIEDKASGQSLIHDLKMNTTIPIIAIKADANKKIRLEASTPAMEAGRVFFPDKSRWIVEVETQLARFPLWSFDDIVDSISQFINWSVKPRYRRSKVARFWK
jgi:predicted phage terminase large subunit-like protein